MRAEQPPVSIDDPEWDDVAEAVLADSPYDTDLGRRMALDAIRVARGDLDRAAFHREYRPAVGAEFGDDARPTASEWFDG